jgi:hypothetical protein
MRGKLTSQVWSCCPILAITHEQTNSTVIQRTAVNDSTSSFKTLELSQVWRITPINPALWRLRQKN